MARPRLTTARVAFVALLACAALYGRGLGGAFVIDDRTYFIDNDDLPAIGLAGAATVFTHPTNAWGEFLPLRDLLFVAEHAAFGRSTFGYHVVSLLLYAGICALAFTLARELTERSRGSMATSGEDRGGLAAAVVAAIFLVHPVHVESVAYVTGQKDLLSGIFALGSLLAFARAFRQEERRSVRVALGAGLYGLAIISKLPAIVLAALVPVLYLVSDPARRPTLRRAALAWTAINVPAALWFEVSRRAGMARWTSTSAITATPFGDRLPVALKILGAHTRLAIWPHPLSFGYPFDGSPAPDSNLIAGVATLAVVGAIVVWFRREPAVVFGGALFLLFLLPVLQLTGSLNNASIYDRYLFLPVLGLALMLERVARSILLERTASPTAYGVVSLAIVVACATITFSHIPAFADDVAVSRNSYLHYPRWSSPPFELAYSLLEAGRTAEARALLSAEPSLDSPTWVRPYLEGWATLAEGRAEDAVPLLRRASMLAFQGGYYPFPSIPLGRALLRIGQPAEAEWEARRALESPIYRPVETYQARKLLQEIEGRRARN